MTELKQPNDAAIRDASRPRREPNFWHVKSPENDRIIIRVFVDWGDGSPLDSVEKDVCSVDNDHELFIEVEDAIVRGLERTLRQRKNASTAPGPKT